MRINLYAREYAETLGLDVVWADAEKVDECGSLSHLDWQDAEPFSGYVPVVKVPSTYTDDAGYSDAVGVANSRYMHDNYGVEPWLIRFDYSMGGTEYGVALDLLPDSDGSVEVESILDLVHGLEDYPLIDEGLHAEVEAEFVKESIDDYLLSDIKREIPEEWEDAADEREEMVEETITEGIWESYYSGHAYLEGEGLYLPKWESDRIVTDLVERFKASSGG